MIEPIDQLHILLARAQIALARRAGTDVEALRKRLEPLRKRSHEYKYDVETRTPLALAELVRDVQDVHEAVKAWAVASRVFYASADSAPTIPRMTTEELRAAIDSMPAGSGDVPDAVLAEMAEAQLAIPIERPTTRKLEELAGDDLDDTDEEDPGSAEG